MTSTVIAATATPRALFSWAPHPNRHTQQSLSYAQLCPPLNCFASSLVLVLNLNCFTNSTMPPAHNNQVSPIILLNNDSVFPTCTHAFVTLHITTILFNISIPSLVIILHSAYNYPSYITMPSQNDTYCYPGIYLSYLLLTPTHNLYLLTSCNISLH